jgi:hypothetical protein
MSIYFDNHKLQPGEIKFAADVDYYVSGEVSTVNITYRATKLTNPVIIDSAGVHHDLTDDGTYHTLQLTAAGPFTADFSAVEDPAKAYFGFGAHSDTATEIKSSITSLTLSNLKGLKRLDFFAARLIGLTSLNIETSVSTVESFEYSFLGVSLNAFPIPPDDYASATTATGMFKIATMDCDLTLNMPSLVYADSMFYCHNGGAVDIPVGRFKNINIDMPVCVDCGHLFDYINGDCDLTVVMGPGKATNVEKMFTKAGVQDGSALCIKGTLDTTVAGDTTTTMFDGAEITQPNEADRTELIAGAVKTYTECSTSYYVRGIAETTTIPYMCNGLIGATITDSAGVVFDLTCDDTYRTLTLTATGEFIADFVEIDPAVGSDAYFAFAAADAPIGDVNNSISELTVLDLKGLTSLRYFAGRLVSVTVNVDVDTSQVWNMYGMFMWNTINSFPTMDFSSVTKAASMFYKAVSSVPLVLDMPAVQDVGFMFDSERSTNSPQGLFTSINIKIPSATDVEKLFNDINGDCELHVEMGVGLSVNAKEMFRYAGRSSGPLCVTGYLDTTNATDTSSMFASSDVSQPDAADQSDLREGAVFTYTDC